MFVRSLKLVACQYQSRNQKQNLNRIEFSMSHSSRAHLQLARSLARPPLLFIPLAPPRTTESLHLHQRTILILILILIELNWTNVELCLFVFERESRYALTFDCATKLDMSLLSCPSVATSMCVCVCVCFILNETETETKTRIRIQSQVCFSFSFYFVHLSCLVLSSYNFIEEKSLT